MPGRSQPPGWRGSPYEETHSNHKKGTWGNVHRKWYQPQNDTDPPPISISEILLALSPWPRFSIQMDLHMRSQPLSSSKPSSVVGAPRPRLWKCHRAESPAGGNLQMHAERMGSIRDNCNSRGDNYTMSPGLCRATPLTSGKHICCIPNMALASPALHSHSPLQWS